MPYLELQATQSELRPLEGDGEFVVGSGSQTAWRLTGQDLAARHFTLRPDAAGGLAVAPCSPAAVVIVNGEQLVETGGLVGSGDVIAAGSARFVYLERHDDPRPRPLEEREPAFLLDAAEGVAYALTGRVVQIGREIGCHIVVRDPTVSRFHADIRREAGEYILYSAGASGSTLNGEPVTTPRMLRPHDELRIGSCTLSFIRGPLPVGVRQAGFEVRSEGALHRRATLTHGNAVPAGHTSLGVLKLGAALALSVLAGALLVALL